MENLETRLNEVARIAVRLEQETGCPAQLMIAQWAIESAWGAKPVGHANYFGIKKADRHTKCSTVPTREVINGKSVIENLEFADYDSLEDSCRDYAWLITAPAAIAEPRKYRRFMECSLCPPEMAAQSSRAARRPRWFWGA